MPLDRIIVDSVVFSLNTLIINSGSPKYDGVTLRIEFKALPL